MKSRYKQIKFSILLLLISLLWSWNPAFAIELSSLNLIREYRISLNTQNSDKIRAAYEALKADKKAVAYMKKNLSYLYSLYQKKEFSETDIDPQMEEEEAHDAELVPIPPPVAAVAVEPVQLPKPEVVVDAEPVPVPEAETANDNNMPPLPEVFLDTVDMIPEYEEETMIEAIDAPVDDLPKTNSSGKTEAKVPLQTDDVLTRTIDKIEKVHLDKQLENQRVQEKRADAKRAAVVRTELAKFPVDWNTTISDVNTLILDLNAQDAQKVRPGSEEVIQLIKQMQNGTLSDEDFTRQLTALEDQLTILDQAGRRGWTLVIDTLMEDQVNPGIGGIIPGNTDRCTMSYVMKSVTNFECRCPGYTFDYSQVKCVNTGGGNGKGQGSEGDVAAILSSVPPDKVDKRTVQCNSTSKSRGNTPASINVDMGGASGTAQISYDFYSVKDRIIVQQGGTTLMDTGCRNKDASVSLPVSGGSPLHVVVRPACAGSSTSWKFTVSCPER